MTSDDLRPVYFMWLLIREIQTRILSFLSLQNLFDFFE